MNVSRKTRFVVRTYGVTLIEMLVGVAIFLGVGAGAYGIYTKTTQRAQEAQKQAKYSRALKTFLESFRHQVENAVQLPNAESSTLQLTRPTKCITDLEKSETLAWGMIPYPGHDATHITTSLASFDPSSVIVDEAAYASDAILMIYISEDSIVNYFAFCGDPADQIVCSSTGTDPIQLVGSVENLQVGDYAIVSDANRKELIRITGISAGAGTTNIEHNPAKSVWNKTFDTSIGGTSNALGQPVLYKVNIVTYAHDADSQTLLKDDHSLDDHFDPTAKTFGTPGLKLHWDVVAPGISKFQISYLRMDETETRTPQIGMPTKTYDKCSTAGHADNCGCENELGNPVLKTVKAIIDFAKPETTPTGPSSETDTTTEAFNPTVLKKGLPFLSSDHPGCQTSSVLYTTLDDGSHNPACDNKYCICSDRTLPSLCERSNGGPGCPGGGGSPPTGDTGYGGGGNG